MDKIVVLGGGGHAKVVLSILRKMKTWNILGYTDESDRGVLLEATWLGNDQALPHIIRENHPCNAVVGVGSLGPAGRRMRLWELLRSMQFELPAILSPQAIVNSDVSLGKGTVVFDGSVVNTGTTIGECAIINSNSTVEHDCDIGDFVHVAPGATVSGGVKIGRNTMIGAGAVVIQGLTVAENCLIGAGATVVDDCLAPGTYLGTPARRVR